MVADPSLNAQDLGKTQDIALLDNGESDNESWTFIQKNKKGEGSGSDKDSWIKCESFPTSVHVELIAQKKIPDPVSRAPFTPLD